MKQLIECVPNFSEGNDLSKIKEITNAIETVDGVKLLDVDPGKATNRTVVTFVGEPKSVIEAAYRGVKKASEVLDMTKHSGEHPRFGATDVCPLVPISNISMEETVEYARELGERIGNDLNIPIYAYENAAFDEKRKNLAYCRSGEYEGLKEKLTKPEWKPDFGPAEFNAKAGATAVSARNFLVAYNINLNTTSTRKANSIAFDVRENGRVKREGGKLTGKILKDKNGKTLREPGTLKSVKAIGWYIEEYQIAQISMNLTDITITSVHEAYDEVYRCAGERGIRVTGSELVGLMPKKALLDAGKYFLQKQERSLGISEREIIKIAVKSLGLDELKPFIPEERIIEYMLGADHEKLLVNCKLNDFADKTASEVPAPGGGSISAYMGALGAALGTMVANLSSHKRGWDAKWKSFSDVAEKGQHYKEQLLDLVDEDTKAFNNIMAAFRLPKSTDEQKLLRKKAIQDATKYAIDIPFKVMELSYGAMSIMKEMAEIGMKASVSDAGVGALAAKAAVSGAFLNVKINLSGLDDKSFAEEIKAKGKDLEEKAEQMQNKILKIVNKKIEE
ncbi:MAG: glutamate formimidoyltransferase [Bacteroidota bacterium]|nr:glutamate formimidoyltransferase [Bacteroidota bacterium]